MSCLSLSAGSKTKICPGSFWHLLKHLQVLAYQREAEEVLQCISEWVVEIPPQGTSGDGSLIIISNLNLNSQCTHVQIRIKNRKELCIFIIRNFSIAVILRDFLDKVTHTQNQPIWFAEF